MKTSHLLLTLAVALILYWQYEIFVRIYDIRKVDYAQTVELEYHKELIKDLQKQIDKESVYCFSNNLMTARVIANEYNPLFHKIVDCIAELKEWKRNCENPKDLAAVFYSVTNYYNRGLKND